MTIGQAWIDINQRAIDSDHGTDVESVFRHLRARLAAARTLKIAVEVPARLMVVSAEHVPETLAIRVAMHVFYRFAHDERESSPLFKRILDECGKEDLRCAIRRHNDSTDPGSHAPATYELRVEPLSG